MIGLVLAMLWSRRGRAVTVVLLTALATGCALAAPVYLARADDRIVRTEVAGAAIAERTVLISGEVQASGGGEMAKTFQSLAEGWLDTPGYATVFSAQFIAQPADVEQATAAQLSAVVYREDLCGHVTVVAGRCLMGVGDTVLIGRAADRLGLRPGDTVSLSGSQYDTTSNRYIRAGPPTGLTVVGVVQPRDGTEPYWGRAGGGRDAFQVDRRTLNTFVRPAELQSFDAYPRPGAITVDTLPALREWVTDAQDREADGARLNTDLENLLDRIAERRAEVRATVPFAVAPVLLLAWAVITLAVATVIRGRRFEHGIIALRGVARPGRWWLATGETLLSVLAGALLGFSAAGGWQTRGAWPYAAVAVLGALAVAVTVALRTVSAPVSALLRQVDRPTARWRGFALEGLVVVAAIVAVGQVRGRPGGVAMLAPALVMLAAAVVAGRLVPTVVGMLATRALRRPTPPPGSPVEPAARTVAGSVPSAGSQAGVEDGDPSPSTAAPSGAGRSGSLLSGSPAAGMVSSAGLEGGPPPSGASPSEAVRSGELRPGAAQPGTLRAGVTRAGESRAGAAWGRMRLAGVLAGLRVARRPVGARLLVLLTLAVGSLGFAAAATAAVDERQQQQAELDTGAPVVLSVDATSRTQLLRAVRAADPGGTAAMAVVPIRASGSGEPAAVAVDAARLPAVALWPAGGGAVVDVAAGLHPPSTAPPVLVTAATLSLDLSVTALDRPDVALAAIVAPLDGRPTSVVDLGLLTSGRHTYTTPTPICANGCRFVELTVRLPPLVGPTVVLTLHNPPTTGWRTAPGARAEAGADGVTFTLPMTSLSDAGVLRPAGGPERVPVVSAMPLPPEGTFTTFGRHAVPASPVMVTRLPRVGTGGLLVDLEYADLVAADDGSAAGAEVWLSSSAPATILDALREQGLTVTGRRTVADTRAGLAAGGTALGLRFYLVAGILSVALGAAGLVVAALGAATADLRALRVQGLHRTAARLVEPLVVLVLVGSAGVAGVLAAMAAWVAVGGTLPGLSGTGPPPLTGPVAAVALTLLFLAAAGLLAQVRRP